MFGWVARFSLQFRILVPALAARRIAFGMVNIPHMAVGITPQSVPGQGEIQNEVLGFCTMEPAGYRP
ncbi:Cu/Ag efflux pump CusA [Arthrobacter pascens]|uniref:hypothetical protein n=1 Tax=Arthrobacter pascens TaxID=1677 RepID=UPI0027865F67|nr:hypothetical protein [Arthrobacter pascens]MDQ0633833.1 Cu/Ag efflux pump CusA [Arthrobacter pascens]